MNATGNQSRVQPPVRTIACAQVVNAEHRPCDDHDLNLFYPVSYEMRSQVQAAKNVCGGCPVKDACLQWALETGDAHAILGASTPQERRRMRSQGRVA